MASPDVRRAFALAVLVLAGCADDPATTIPSAPDEPAVRSALVVTLDTTRADAIGAFGGPDGVTPHLDALAAQGVVYRDARTVAPITQPAHASMFTGLYPPRHTVRDNNVLALPDEADTLAERARDHGRATAAVVASIAVDRAFGLGQGFDHYDQPTRALQRTSTEFEERRAGAVTDAALAWLDALPDDEPFVLWAHYFDPHGPYTPPAPFLDQAGGHVYLGEVASTDHHVGRLIDGLRARDLLDTTLVIVVADHGEGLGDHGEPAHGTHVWDSTIRVPMLVRDPSGARAGEVSDEVVSVVDVFPTVVDALGLGATDGLDGASLFRRRVPDDRGVYFESYGGYLAYGWSPLAGWADADGAYVHGSAPVFVPADARGTTGRPVAPDDDATDAYRRAIGRVADAPRLSPDSAGGDAELVERLRALGYAAVGDATDLPHPLAPTDRPSPHARTDELQRTLVAQALTNAGRLDDALPMLRDLVSDNPDNRVALERLGGALITRERFAEAIPVLERLLGVGDDDEPDASAGWAGAWYNLGVARHSTGDRAGGNEAFERAVSIDRGHVQSLYYLEKFLEEDGRPGDAAHYRALLEEARGEG